MTTVLLIEDNDLVRMALRIALELADLTVIESEDGSVFRNPGALDGVDIVVTDLIMPNVEGFEVLMKMRQTAPDTPIIAISGGGRINSADLLQSARLLGAAAIFHKPLDERHLIEKIRELTES